MTHPKPDISAAAGGGVQETVKMVASNTKDCFREFVGQRVKGLLFDALPNGRDNLSSGTKTIIFEDGRGLTIAGNGSFWIDGPDEINLAIKRSKAELKRISRDLSDVLALAGKSK
jgi:hypothetical protein